jgi:hypothetical protein
VASLSSATTAPDGGRVAVDRRVGARLHLRVPGDLRPAVTVIGVDARYDGTVNPVAAGSATVTYTIENTGNVRVSGTPQIGVTGPFGRAAVTATGEPIGELLPGSRLTRTTTVTGVWPLVRISADVSIDPSPVAAPAPDPPAAVAGTTTWAFPWPQLVLLAAIAFIAVVLRRRRRAHRAQLAAAREQGRQEALTAGDVKGANPDGSARKPLLLRTSASPRREPANRDLS